MNVKKQCIKKKNKIRNKKFVTCTIIAIFFRYCCRKIDLSQTIDIDFYKSIVKSDCFNEISSDTCIIQNRTDLVIELQKLVD